MSPTSSGGKSSAMPTSLMGIRLLGILAALGDGVVIKLAYIPKGKFLMGSISETKAEQPVTKVSIKDEFWMGSTEVTLEQFTRGVARQLRSEFNRAGNLKFG